LPAVLSETAVKALSAAAGNADAPATAPASVLGEIRRLAEGLNAKTWKATRAKLFELAGKE
jgi:hypothetical protein